MAAPASVVRFEAGVAATDFADIWNLAIARYEETTKTELVSLSSAGTVDDVLREIRGRGLLFKLRRHKSSRIDTFRALVTRSLKPIQVVTETVGQGVSNVFPPGMAIFTAVRYLISTANAVSADYDKLTEFFEDLDAYLGRVKVLESRMSLIPELQNALAEVLSSVLILCGISARYIKTRRIGESNTSSFLP
ncbi:hypothetical protein P170DRAFT_259882 [Aspergillus steynii IBT 23096]|uniref:Fungal STAND N-terminal Goodbye domain-containing protein n=1 Tax=Aspergillus steynii IBT 23096 TaxID=1392250 RepID=A0A2I2FZP1_9EURO|nr:uncharacterized protein P170DRAFT_259882 [Aspergillus steynii IBT 23096]PLB46084.1 hypothetical protein P170DRAFT_259882 [Aspergillus steynii IBT 23096]